MCLKKVVKTFTKLHRIPTVVIPDGQLLHLCRETAGIFNPPVTQIECQAAQPLCVQHQWPK